MRRPKTNLCAIGVTGGDQGIIMAGLEHDHVLNCHECAEQVAAVCGCRLAAGIAQVHTGRMSVNQVSSRVMRGCAVASSREVDNQWSA